MVPEQRVLRIARIGPEQVAGVTASDQEIAAYYNANKATYGGEGHAHPQPGGGARPGDARTRSPPRPRPAHSLRRGRRAKRGGDIAQGPDAARPMPASPATRSRRRSSRAATGAVVGPIQSDFGWVVVKVDSVKTEGGKSLAQARAEIAAKLTADKRKQAIEDLVDKVQNAVDEGSNFAEAAAAAKLPVTTTPLITADRARRAPTRPSSFPPSSRRRSRPGSRSPPNDPPEIVVAARRPGLCDGLAGRRSFRPPRRRSPAFATGRQRLDRRARRAQRAKAAADAIAAKAARGVPLAQAVKEAGAPPSAGPAARRPAHPDRDGARPRSRRRCRCCSRSRRARAGWSPDPQGRGFFVVKVDKIMPGNALLQPTLISQMQSELQQTASDDYARAVRRRAARRT